jgi:hypothetical protein
VRQLAKADAAAHIVLHSPANMALVADCIECLRPYVAQGHSELCHMRFPHACRPQNHTCTCGHDRATAALNALDAVADAHRTGGSK